MKNKKGGDLFYEGSAWKIGNNTYHFYMCQGQRGRGKTTYYQNMALHRALNNPQHSKFFFCRRSDEQMKEVISKGLFGGCRHEGTEDFWKEFSSYRIDRGRIFLQKDEKKEYHVGYLQTLNNVKGAQVDDADLFIFDEYVEPERRMYKGGDAGTKEPELLGRLLDTKFRRRDYWCVLLGNFDSPTNPYNEYFHVPFGIDFYKNKQYSLWYEVDYSSATEEAARKTTTGKIFGNTNYFAYSNGNVAMGQVDEELICPVPANAKQLVNLKVHGELLTIWFDETTSIEYVTNDRKLNTSVPVLSFTSSDMSVNSLFVQYNTDFIQQQQFIYGRGRVRFNSQKTASFYNILLSIK